MLGDLINRLSLVFDYKSSATGPTRDKTLAIINAAAREIWHMTDLPGSLMEQAFTFDRSQNQISLPWYVDHIRAVRRRNTGTKIILEDMRPRYHHTPWRQPYWTFRIKGTSPLIKPLAAESQLTVTLGAAEAKTVEVAITGQSTTASRTREVLRFLPGATTATTTAQFTTEAPFGVTSITKDSRTLADVTVTDALGNTVAMIASTEKMAKNTIISVTDLDNPAQSLDDVMEVLFKLPCFELYYDEDLFANSPQLEDALYWLARSHYHSTFLDADGNSSNMAVAENAKAMEVLTAFVENLESDAEHKIQVGINRFSEAWAQNRVANIGASGGDYYVR
jgi:hypothetical protein